MSTDTTKKEKTPLTRRLKSLFVHRLGLFIESEPDVLALVLNALHCTAGAKVNCGVVDQISLHISPTGDIHLAIALPARGSKQSSTHWPRVWEALWLVPPVLCVGPDQARGTVVSRCG